MQGTLCTRNQIAAIVASWTADNLDQVLPPRGVLNAERLILIPVALRDTGHTHARVTNVAGIRRLYRLEFVNR